MKKNSWHYKVASWGHDNPSDNLCNHFWTVVFKLVVAFVFIVMAACIGVSALIGLTYPLLNLIFGLVISDGYGMSFFWWTFVLIGLIVYRQTTLPYKPKQPSLLGEFIRAKKNKWCPKIQWED